MQNMMGEKGTEGVLEGLLQEKNEMVVVEGQKSVSNALLRAQLAALAEENERLKEKFKEKESESAEKDKKVENFERRALEAEKALKVEQDRQRADQEKIDRLSVQLEKVEKLLQKLLTRKKPSKSGAEFQSPQVSKQKPALQSGKSKGEHTSNDHIGAFRSSRADYMSSIRDSPGISGSSYASKMTYSPSSSFKGDSQEYRRYRREKLLASQNVGDILRIEKMMNN